MDILQSKINYIHAFTGHADVRPQRYPLERVEGVVLATIGGNVKA